MYDYNVKIRANGYRRIELHLPEYKLNYLPTEIIKQKQNLFLHMGSSSFFV